MNRVVVGWEGADWPILLSIYDADNKVAVMPLSPTRALELAKELIAPAVQSIKHSHWGPNWPG